MDTSNDTQQRTQDLSQVHGPALVLENTVVFMDSRFATFRNLQALFLANCHIAKVS